MECNAELGQVYLVNVKNRQFKTMVVNASFKFFLLLFLVLLAGCNESGSEFNSSQAQDGSSEEQPFVIKPEIYGDPDIFDGPRIQFAMSAPGENRDTIWSIKTDGTDLRQAVDYELLYGDGSGGFIHPPVRSPDNRYIVLSVARGVEFIEKQLIDLKTNTKITFAEGGGIPLFQWNADSNEIFFHMDKNLWRYHVEQKTMTKEVKIGYQGTYYLRDKDQFFVVQKDGFELFDRKGKSIRKVVLNTKWGLKEWHQLSADGELFVYNQKRGIKSYVIKTAYPSDIILDTKLRGDLGSFSKNGKQIYFRHGGFIATLDVPTGEPSKLYSSPDGFGSISGVSLINY
ncbi:hypothetical protein [Alkalimarinus coralli]|uniref:hypothetical protein n=1 Tax=Alkalimarinus coralli TaxID=2935863 RepID=UPI00202B4E5C|nr:hypothetical protein [Alkalimarinus coralli]